MGWYYLEPLRQPGLAIECCKSAGISSAEDFNGTDSTGATCASQADRQLCQQNKDKSCRAANGVPVCSTTFTDYKVDIAAIVGAQCNGKQSCQPSPAGAPSTNQWFKDVGDPCFGGDKYVRIDYLCGKYFHNMRSAYLHQSTLGQRKVCKLVYRCYMFSLHNISVRNRSQTAWHLFRLSYIPHRASPPYHNTCVDWLSWQIASDHGVLPPVASATPETAASTLIVQDTTMTTEVSRRPNSTVRILVHHV